MSDVIVYKNRRNVISMSLGRDVSDDTFESQIREKARVDAPLIAEWVVSFATDGEDGELLLTLDDSDLSDITQKSGYMDLKRTSGGEPYQVFAPMKVLFKDTVTE